MTSAVKKLIINCLVDRKKEDY